MQAFILDSRGSALCSMSPDSNAQNVMNFFNDSWKQQTNVPETFEFEVLANDPKASNLKELNQVLFTHNNKTHLFTIIEVQATHSDTEIIHCYCESVGLELLNNVVLPNKFASVSAENALAYVLTDTDWQVGTVDYFPAHDIEFSSFGTVLAEVQNIATLYECQIGYRVEYNSGKVTGKYIDLLEAVGQDKGIRFEYGRNAQEIRKTVSASNIMTAIIPIGNNDLTISGIACDKETHGFEKSIGQYYIELTELERSEIATGDNHIFGTFQVETDDPNELAIKGYEELQKQKVGQIEYEFNPVLLDNTAVELGDTVYCIDRELGDLQLSAEITELTISFSDPNQDNIVLANYKVVEETIADSLTKLQATLKNANLDNPLISVSPVDPSEKYPLIQENTLWVDTSAVASGGTIVLKQYENGQWNQAISEEVIEELVETKAEEVVTPIINEKIAVKAGTTAPANPYVGQLWLDQTNEISILKRWDGEAWRTVGLNEEDMNNLLENYNEEVDGKIALVTAEVTKLEGSLSSKVEKTEYDLDIEQINADIATVNGNISNQQTTIKQLSDSIDLKASQASMDLLTGEVSKNTAQINLNATNIESKVSKDGVISSINQSAEEIKINADKLTLEGTNGLKVLIGNNVEMGGRNLLLNSSYRKNKDGWFGSNASQITKTEKDGYPCFKVASTAFQTTQAVYQNIVSRADTNAIKNGQELTFSGWFYVESYEAGTTNNLTGLYFSCNSADGFMGSTAVNGNGRVNDLVGKGWQRVVYTAKYNQGVAPTSMNMYAYFRDFKGIIYFRDLKVETGCVATAWTPAPEDNVTTDNVIGAINATNESITIDFEKINLIGKVTADHISATGLNASNIKTGTLSGVSIDVTTDVKCGRYLKLNQQTDNAFPGIIFQNASGTEIGCIKMNSLNDLVVFNSKNVVDQNGWRFDGVETGVVGIGGQTTVTTSNSLVAGYVCQYKQRRSTVPTTITLTALSASGANKDCTSLDRSGFWFWIVNTSSTSGYKYWRGTYSVGSNS